MNEQAKQSLATALFEVMARAQVDGHPIEVHRSHCKDPLSNNCPCHPVTVTINDSVEDVIEQIERRDA